MVRLYLILGIVFLTIGCKDAATNTEPKAPAITHKNVQSYQWLLGTWRSQMDNSYEVWKAVNDTLLEGYCYTAKNGDTTIIETIQIVAHQDSIYYIPTVKSQNNGLPIPFYVHKSSDTSFESINPKHDFPVGIRYVRRHTDSITAYLLQELEEMEQKPLVIPMYRVQ